jgi:hypothetical protein
MTDKISGYVDVGFLVVAALLTVPFAMLWMIAAGLDKVVSKVRQNER